MREKLERTSTQLHTADLIEGTDAYEEFDAKYTRDYEEYDKEFDLWVRWILLIQKYNYIY